MARRLLNGQAMETPQSPSSQIPSAPRSICAGTTASWIGLLVAGLMGAPACVVETTGIDSAKVVATPPICSDAQDQVVEILEAGLSNIFASDAAQDQQVRTALSEAGFIGPQDTFRIDRSDPFMEPWHISNLLMWIGKDFARYFVRYVEVSNGTGSFLAAEVVAAHAADVEAPVVCAVAPNQADTVVELENLLCQLDGEAGELADMADDGEDAEIPLPIGVIDDAETGFVRSRGSLAGAGDIDVWTLGVIDGLSGHIDSTDPNPDVHVELRVPGGQGELLDPALGFSLSVEVECYDDRVEAVRCTDGVAFGSELNAGCDADHASSVAVNINCKSSRYIEHADDSGLVRIRVEAPPTQSTCVPYEVAVKVD